VSGIVLAGGRSTRFGTDKLAATYRGRPLLEHAIDALQQTCDEIIVVVAADAPDPDLPTVRVARDTTESEGPLAGLLAGLGSASCERALVVGGDMPELVRSVLSAMLDRLDATDAGAVALHDGDLLRPLPCAVRTDRADAVAQDLFDAGERSLRALLRALDVDAIDEATWAALDPDRRTLLDVDEPGDLPLP
jgi:molybdopterin-guanine dinucleotide biosynthesis protein A